MEHPSCIIDPLDTRPPRPDTPWSSTQHTHHTTPGSWMAPECLPPLTSFPYNTQLAVERTSLVHSCVELCCTTPVVLPLRSTHLRHRACAIMHHMFSRRYDQQSSTRQERQQWGVMSPVQHRWTPPCKQAPLKCMNTASNAGNGPEPICMQATAKKALRYQSTAQHELLNTKNQLNTRSPWNPSHQNPSTLKPMQRALPCSSQSAHSTCGHLPDAPGYPAPRHTHGHLQHTVATRSAAVSAAVINNPIARPET